MSNHAYLLASIKSPRKPEVFDSMTKAQIWAQLQAAAAALANARTAAQSAATAAHNYAQGSNLEVRRQFLTLRDAAYAIRDAV